MHKAWFSLVITPAHARELAGLLTRSKIYDSRQTAFFEKATIPRASRTHSASLLVCSLYLWHGHMTTGKRTDKALRERTSSLHGEKQKQCQQQRCTLQHSPTSIISQAPRPTECAEAGIRGRKPLASSQENGARSFMTREGVNFSFSHGHNKRIVSFVLSPLDSRKYCYVRTITESGHTPH